MRAVKSQSLRPARALNAYVLPRAMKAEKCFPQFLWGIGPLNSLSMEARLCSSLHLSLYLLGQELPSILWRTQEILPRHPGCTLSLIVGMLWAGRKLSFLPQARMDPHLPLLCLAPFWEGKEASILGGLWAPPELSESWVGDRTAEALPLGLSSKDSEPKMGMGAWKEKVRASFLRIRAYLIFMRILFKRY